MSMTLQDMTQVATLTHNLLSKANASGSNNLYGAAATTDPLAKMLDAAGQRISAQISQTDVQLSSYGQIKSAFASLQTSGRALTTLSKDASATDIGKAAQSFVAAYNSATSAVSTAVNGNGKNPGALADDALARLSGNNLRRIVSSGSGIGDLQKMGISVGQNGSLSVDTQALGKAIAANPNAVKSRLAKIGQQANSAATAELSSGGGVGSAVNSLNNRSKNLATQRSQQQGLAASMQAAMQQSSLQSSGFGSMSSGIAAYRKAFSL